jgi:hypothetical protein
MMINLMRWYHREPTLEDILSDSIVRDVMEADGVDPQELAAMLREMAGHLNAAQRSGARSKVRRIGCQAERVSG